MMNTRLRRRVYWFLLKYKCPEIQIDYDENSPVITLYEHFFLNELVWVVNDTEPLKLCLLI